MYKDILARNKNLIHLTERQLKGNYLMQNINVLSYAGINYHGLVLHLNFYLKEIDLVSYAQENVVVIGIPLDRIKVQVQDILEPRDYSVRQYFKNLEIDKGGLTQQEAFDMNYFINHCNEFPASTYAAEITNTYKSCEYTYSLATSEFPKIVNREVLPVIILDFEKSTVSFFCKENVKSYREGRSKILLRDFKPSSPFIFDNCKWNTIPSALIEAQLEFKGGKEQKLRFQGIPYSTLKDA